MSSNHSAAISPAPRPLEVLGLSLRCKAVRGPQYDKNVSVLYFDATPLLRHFGKADTYGFCNAADVERARKAVWAPDRQYAKVDVPEASQGNGLVRDRQRLLKAQDSYYAPECILKGSNSAVFVDCGLFVDFVFWASGFDSAAKEQAVAALNAGSEDGPLFTHARA